MPATPEKKRKKQGFFALLKASIVKSSEGCGPGCGCHTATAKKPATGSTAAKTGKKA